MTGASSASWSSSTRLAARRFAPLALLVQRKIRSGDVLAVLAEPFAAPGPPAHIRSDNGPGFIATAVRTWLAQVGVRTLHIEPGSSWKNGYCESFNGSLRDELLNGEIFLHAHRGGCADRGVAPPP